MSLDYPAYLTIFDCNRCRKEGGSPLVAVRVQVFSSSPSEGATDRLGLFRLNDLPQGPLRVDLRWNQEQEGWSRIPAETVESICFCLSGLSWEESQESANASAV
jgi:hypothetical protein